MKLFGCLQDSLALAHTLTLGISLLSVGTFLRERPQYLESGLYSEQSWAGSFWIVGHMAGWMAGHKDFLWLFIAC